MTKNSKQLIDKVRGANRSFQSGSARDNDTMRNIAGGHRQYRRHTGFEEIFVLAFIGDTLVILVKMATAQALCFQLPARPRARFC